MNQVHLQNKYQLVLFKKCQNTEVVLNLFLTKLPYLFFYKWNVYYTLQLYKQYIK